jgi:hypothetical protein
MMIRWQLKHTNAQPPHKRPTTTYSTVTQSHQVAAKAHQNRPETHICYHTLVVPGTEVTEWHLQHTTVHLGLQPPTVGAASPPSHKVTAVSVTVTMAWSHHPSLNQGSPVLRVVAQPCCDGAGGTKQPAAQLTRGRWHMFQKCGRTHADSCCPFLMCDSWRCR